MPTIEQTSRAVTTIRMEVSSGWEQWFLLRADAHHDNKHCLQDVERKHLEQAKARQALILDFGDLFCAMQGKWDKRADQSQLREELRGNNYLDLLVQTTSDFYSPYAKLFALLGQGNHETAILKYHQTNLTDRLAERLKALSSSVVVGGFSGWVRFIFSYQNSGNLCSRVLKWHHGYGGDAPVTKGTIQTNRMAVYLPDADFVVTGHCFSEDTEVLTSKGWRHYSDLVCGDLIATMNKKTKELEYQLASSMHVYTDYKKLHHIHNKHTDLLVTDKHGLCYQSRKSHEYGECQAKAFREKRDLELFVGALDTSPDFPCSDDLLRLLVWTVADGCLEGPAIRFHLKKERKIRRLTSLLSTMGVPVTTYVQKNGNTKMRIGISHAPYLINLLGSGKTLPQWFYKLSGRQAKVVLEEYRNTDGLHRPSVSCTQLYSSVMSNLDVLQALSVKAAWRGHISPRVGAHRLNLSKRGTTFFQKGKSKLVPYSGPVWCLTVPNGTLIVRRNGKTTVTLNTHNEWLFPIERERITHLGTLYKDQQIHIKVPGYKDEYADGYEGWHTERGGPPKPIGACWLRFFYLNNTIQSELLPAK